MKCCDEHVELAIDIYVDENELAPEIIKIDQNAELPTTCEYCENPAVYIVGN
ncbi:CxxH/CxxC protein [Metabacillus sp. GX 13764]|uniref:CxxH/CxxC protein n=1 Tax=Metabacillus kandeliae TaxID=2900151 RepID=UPI001E44D11C|nr:CxxH/CxxC protein [Metabacillus kandeliae]MCD7035318.1 CxxH/CxxC protein [Metabacillus kandeliae]